MTRYEQIKLGFAMMLRRPSNRESCGVKSLRRKWVVISRIALIQDHGTIANTRAGNPEPLRGFGKVTIARAPDSGAWSRLQRSSIW